MAPIDYSALQARLDFSPLIQGLQQRRQNRALAAQVEQRQAATQLAQQQFDAEQASKSAEDARRQSFLARWKQVADAPSIEGYASIRAEFPDQMQAIDAGQKAFDERQRAVGRDIATGVQAHLIGGDTAAALAAIDGGIQQFGEVGRPVTSLQTLRAMLASGKPQQIAAAKRVATMMLAQEAGDQYGSVLGALSREQQDAELLPDRVRRADADADFAETRAAYAPAQQLELLRGRRVRTANTSSLLSRREAPRPSPRTPSRPEAGITVRPGEQTATDGKGGVFVVRKGQWVRAR